MPPSASRGATCLPPRDSDNVSDASRASRLHSSLNTCQLLILSNGLFFFVLQLLEIMSPPWRRHSVKSKPDVSPTTAGESPWKTLIVFFIFELLLLFLVSLLLCYISFLLTVFSWWSFARSFLFTNYVFYSLFPLKEVARLLWNFLTKRSALWRPIQNCFRSKAPPVSRAASKLRGLRTIMAHRCVGSFAWSPYSEGVAVKVTSDYLLAVWRGVIRCHIFSYPSSKAQFSTLIHLYKMLHLTPSAPMKYP